MKNIILFIFAISLLVSCGSAKSSEQAINTGNYDKAINISLQKLKSNKTKKGNQQYVLMLEEAFAKVVERDQNRIEFLVKDGNPENFEEIYNTYTSLNNRQERIRPLLPLPVHSRGANANFKFNNYNDALIRSKNDLSEHLYQKSIPFIDATDKKTLRNVYYDLEYIEKINPSYKDVPNLMNVTHANGTDYVFVSMKNESESVVPVKLEENLLNFDTYGLNDFWTVYHNAKISDVTYDYGMELNLTKILVSPEKIKGEIIIEEKLVEDGFKYALDANGNQLKDSLGNKIKVDNFIKVRCELYQIKQVKTSKVDGQVKYLDLKSNSVLQVYPISSEFVFEHVYATYKGDKRALQPSYIDLIGLQVVDFPSNEQMIYDTGTDLKKRLKAIIQQNNFKE